jgi:hypothetical protein
VCAVLLAAAVQSALRSANADSDASRPSGLFLGLILFVTLEFIDFPYQDHLELRLAVCIENAARHSQSATIPTHPRCSPKTSSI